MGSDLYETLPLEDLVTIHDKDRKPVTKSDRKAGPYPYYGASGITDYVENYIFDGDYVLLAEDGDNLRTRNTPIAFMARGKFWVNNHAHIVKAKGDESSDYICYALQVADVTSYISGSTRPKITQADMKKIPVSAPPKDVRNSIAHILSSLDNKIQLNRETNQTLEAMAQALFKSWFVDFDPVFDNIIAHNLAHNNAPLHNIPEPLLPHAQRRLNAHNVGRGSARQTAAHAFHHLFPQAFEQSDEPSVGIQGWIPKGWGVSRLDSILELAYGRALKKTERLEGDIPVYGSGGMTGYHNDFLVPGPGIIVGRKGTVGSLYWEDKNFYPIDTVFYVKPMKQYSLEYCFMQLKVLGLENMNTDAAVPGLNRNNAYRLEIVKPEQKIIDKFSDIIKSFQCRKQALQSETENLESLRDTLLPKLISGELRIPDAEQATEALAK